MKRKTRKVLLEAAKKTKIVSEAEAQQANFHLCGTNPEIGSTPASCTICGKTVYFLDSRPGMPKICPDCAAPDIATKGSVTTPQTIQKVASVLYRDKRRN